MTWNPDLTIEDIDTLLDIMKDWERSGPVNELQIIQKLKTVKPAEVLPGLDKAEPHVQEKMSEMIEIARKEVLPKEAQVKLDAKVRTERATLIRAKLILLQQSLSADKAFEE